MIKIVVQINGKNAETLSEDLVRHMVLNSLRSYRSRFTDEFGELVLSIYGDSSNLLALIFTVLFKSDNS